MHFDFASRRTPGGLQMLELKGTDQLKKSSSWPPSSWVKTMSTMPGETRAVINWSSEFIDKTRVCLARHPSFGAHMAFGVWRLAFGVWRLAFGVWRLAFGVWRLAFGVRRSAFGVRRSAFGVRRSAFGVRRLCSCSCSNVLLAEKACQPN
jgi:hypothetical protein